MKPKFKLKRFMVEVTSVGGLFEISVLEEEKQALSASLLYKSRLITKEELKAHFTPANPAALRLFEKLES